MRPSTFTLIGTLALALTASLPAQAVLWPSAVLRVERDLRSAEVGVRRRAAQSLRELPPSSATRLASAALDDADVEVRLAALDACLSLSVAGLGDRLVPWLSDGERRLRLAAAEALGDSPSLRAVPSLGRALADTDQGVRSAAAIALGKSGAPEAALALLGHLDDSVPEVRRDVALALGDLGDVRAVVPLIGKIQDARPIVREGVAEALAQLGDARAVSALLLSLHDADDGVRIAALGALSRIADPSSVPSVAGLLQSASDVVHSVALDTLSHIHSRLATKLLIGELTSERPGRARAEAVSALGRSGEFAIPALSACLNTESDVDRLGGCALAVGETHRAEGAIAIQAALRRSALPALPALLALAELRAPDSLSTVLEYVSDSDVLVRRAARLAAKPLLDPRRPDGRAIEPLEHALTKAHADRSEQSELLDLLGQTGSPRAALSLLPFARGGDDVLVRAHALSALGFLGEAGQVPVLLQALADEESGSVRLAAALALGRLSLGAQTIPLLERLAHASEAERPLLALALGTTLSRARDPEVVKRLESMLQRAQSEDRDALIELLGRVPSAEASEYLARVVGKSSSSADRAKFAEALAAHPAERARLTPLLRDTNGAVRANAAWALAEVGVGADRAALEAAVRDADVNVAGNALQALARIAAREHGKIAELACSRLADGHSAPMLRAAALRALRFTAERCAHGEEINALSHDRADFVRQSAAVLLRDVPRGSADEVALARARDRDPSGAVAAECAGPRAPNPVGVDATVVVVIPPGEDLPRPSQPFALLRADGLVRLGTSDRRGQLFEVAAPHGTLSLIEPATGVE
ncbi:MAG: HEAT repeat domain-containing protein [Polyangiaceae bacterium]